MTLVERLRREYWDPERGWTPPSDVCDEAADRIEALEREVAKWQDKHSECFYQKEALEAALREIAEAKGPYTRVGGAHINALWEEGTKAECFKFYAESWDENMHLRAIARRALEGK